MNDIYDLVCVGFGPAAIAFATAIEDEIRSGKCILNFGANVDHSDPYVPKLCLKSNNCADLTVESVSLNRDALKKY